MSKTYWSSPKTVGPDQNEFGSIEGQGITIQCCMCLSYKANIFGQHLEILAKVKEPDVTILTHKRKSESPTEIP